MEMGQDSKTFHLKWTNYEFNVMQVFDQLFRDDSFVDVTLVCPPNEEAKADNDQKDANEQQNMKHSVSIMAHRVILAATSPYFHHLLHDHPPTQHPIIIMPPEVNPIDLDIVLQFIYRGSVEVPKHRINSVLQVASNLQIRGLYDPENKIPGWVELDEQGKTVAQDPNANSQETITIKRKASPKHRRSKRNRTEVEEEQKEEESEEDEAEDKPMDFTMKTDSNDSEQLAGHIQTVFPTEDEMKSPCETPHHFNKPYTKEDMRMALEALKDRSMSLSRASEMFGIPPTTLWQRANRLGISTPKKDTHSKSWSEEDLTSALEALRNKEISANKAAKRFGIPSSTLYKIARKEQIELASPFNAVQTTWTPQDLDKALEAIKKGMTVQKASSEFGIPSGTLYGRCKKVGIELSKASAAQWSEEDMLKALDSVRVDGMSINQAAIHHNLPYSSLYGRINRLKRDLPEEWGHCNPDDTISENFHPLNFLSPLEEQHSSAFHAPKKNSKLVC